MGGAIYSISGGANLFLYIGNLNVCFALLHAGLQIAIGKFYPLTPPDGKYELYL